MTTTATELPLPEIASRLHNGAWVLAAKPGRDPGIGEVPRTVVLAFHGGAGAVQPFAVWVVYPSGGLEGHYFETIFEAAVAYAERS